MTVGPDPARLHPHFRPIAYGGDSDLPLFAIEESQLGDQLRYAPDSGDRSRAHGVCEAASLMLVAEYQAALWATAPDWRRADL
jgi:uncharacterized protein (DUF952 family)